MGSWKQRFALKAITALSRLLEEPTENDPYHLHFRNFVGEVNRMSGPKVLELGSRNVSGPVRRALFASHVAYTGADIHAGENVDVVADAHRLGASFPPEHFDAVFSISVFEHLAMPWKAVLEINQVLKTGGLVFVSTHPTWPAHELPWDFWRLSSEAFKVLFNRHTGFELVDCVEGLGCSIVPHGKEPSMRGMPAQPARLGVAALARKSGSPSPDLQWPVDVDQILRSQYPVGTRVANRSAEDSAGPR